MVVARVSDSLRSASIESPLESYPRAFRERTEVDSEYAVETVESLAALVSYLPHWKRLSKDCLVPNPFYEPFFLLPALQKTRPAGRVLVAFVFKKSSQRPLTEELVGIFPIERRSNGILSLPRWRLLTTSLILRSVPLLTNQRPECALSAFLKWSAKSGIGLLEFDRVLAEGPFQHALVNALTACGRLPYVTGQSVNATLTRKNHATRTSGKALREINRKHRRLEELGDLQFRSLSETESLSEWQRWFLELEASGWKGRRGTAMMQSDRERELFMTVTRQAWARKKLQMFGLFLDDRPVAMKCNLCSGREGLAWKITYDENFSKFSPGLILELEHKMHFEQQSDLDRIDFCARADHPLCQRIAHEQLCLQRLLIPCDSLVSELYCSAVSFLRRIKRHFRSCRSKSEE